MLKIFLVSLAVTCALCAVPKSFPRGSIRPHKNANVGPDFHPKIILGEDADEGQFPYIVSLNWVGDGHACGASVLTDKWILTAAHCCLTGTDMYVYSGSIFLSGDGQTHNIAQYVVNPNYDADDDWKNDVCLIQIEDQFQFNDRLQQVTLPEQDWPVNDGDLTIITGWGYTDPYDHVIPDRLQVGYDFIALSNEHCQELTNVEPFNGYLCVKGNREGQAVCNGDSGSPLMKDGKQIGVVSWGFIPCGSGLPDFFARVPNYINWIQEVLGKDAQSLKFA